MYCTVVATSLFCSCSYAPRTVALYFRLFDCAPLSILAGQLSPWNCSTTGPGRWLPGVTVHSPPWLPARVRRNRKKQESVVALRSSGGEDLAAIGRWCHHPHAYYYMPHGIMPHAPCPRPHAPYHHHSSILSVKSDYDSTFGARGDWPRSFFEVKY